jgi:hypothetical protein
MQQPTTKQVHLGEGFWCDADENGQATDTLENAKKHFTDIIRPALHNTVPNPCSPITPEKAQQ